jgi:hypothetical protein
MCLYVKQIEQFSNVSEAFLIKKFDQFKENRARDKKLI